MAEPGQDLTAAEVAAAIEEAVSRIQRRVTLAVQWLRGQQGADEIASILESGAVDQIAPDVDRMAEAIASEVNAEYLEGGDLTADAIGTFAKVPGHYTATDSRAVVRMKANDLRLVTGITEEQRTVIRDAMVDGMRANLNPRAIADTIEDTLGLSRQQAEWVRSYRRALESGDPELLQSALERELRDGRSDRSVLRAIDGGKPLSQRQIDSMVDRYTANAIHLRAETIARTEGLRAVHEGMQDAIAAGIDRGDLQADVIALTWWAKLDGRERASHREMLGQTRGYGDPFLSGDGNLLEYPGDPSAPASDTVNCRCTLALAFG
jgi:Phage Mu protein F like protein